MSTSLAGSYMMVRPFSWMLGGFPNEFTLYLMIENGEIKTVPWAFFIYLAVIIALAIIGALYQLLYSSSDPARSSDGLRTCKSRPTSSPRAWRDASTASRKQWRRSSRSTRPTPKRTNTSR
jgi:hypothetical protein